MGNCRLKRFNRTNGQRRVRRPSRDSHDKNLSASLAELVMQSVRCTRPGYSSTSHSILLDVAKWRVEAVLKVYKEHNPGGAYEKVFGRGTEL